MLVQNDLKLHNAWKRTIKLKDLNMIAQSDLKLRSALERLNLVLVIYIIWKGPKQDSPKRPKVT
jgi:hypothetical protein